jgi:hypothetical protein
MFRLPTEALADKFPIDMTAKMFGDPVRIYVFKDHDSTGIHPPTWPFEYALQHFIDRVRPMAAADPGMGFIMPFKHEGKVYKLWSVDGRADCCFVLRGRNVFRMNRPVNSGHL